MDEQQLLRDAEVFEKACWDQSVPERQKEGEKVLLEVRKLPHAVHLCRFVLDRSNSPLVQFQAISALRDCILSAWLSVSSDFKDSIRSYLVSYPLSRALEGVVERQALQAASAVSKRGWLESPENNPADLPPFRVTLFNNIAQILDVAQLTNSVKASLAGSSPPAEVERLHRVAFNLLASLVEEFSFTQQSATRYQMTYEFHRLCLYAFQKVELPRVYQLAATLLNAVLSVLPINTASSTSSPYPSLSHSLPPYVLGVLRGCLRLLSLVFGWDFFDGSTDRFPISSRAQLSQGRDAVKPGIAWKSLLIDADALSLLLRAYAACVQQPELSRLALNSISQLASLSGTIFPDDSTRLGFISALMKASLAMMQMPCSALSSSSSTPSSTPAVVQVSGISQVIVRIATHFRLSSCLQADHSLASVFFTSLGQFTCACLRMLAASKCSREGTGSSSLQKLLGQIQDPLSMAWVRALFAITSESSTLSPSILLLLQDTDIPQELEDAFNALLDAWVLFLGDSALVYSSDPGSGSGTPLSGEHRSLLARICSDVFVTYLTSRISMATSDLEEEGDEGEGENNEESDEVTYAEQLHGVAYMARVDPAACANVLNSLLEERAFRLEQLSQQRETSREVITVLEQLHWLVLISGHYLADTGDGEVPQIPEPINALSALTPAESDPCIRLSNTIFRLMQLDTQTTAAAVNSKRSPSSGSSPLLAQTYSWFLSRWCRSYLMPDVPNISANIMNEYSPQGNGARILDFVVRRVLHSLFYWCGEPGVQENSCKVLFTLSEMRQPPVYLSCSSAFSELLDAYVQNHPALLALPSIAQRTFIQALVNVSDSFGRIQTFQQTATPEQQREQYLRRVMSGVTAPVGDLLQRPDFPKIAGQSTTVQAVMSLIERFRGFARGIIADDKSIFQLCSTSFPTLLRLIEIYGDLPECGQVVVACLKFFRDFVEIQSENLDDDQALMLFKTLVEVFKRIPAAHASRARAALSSTLASAREQAEYRDVMILLQILVVLTSHASEYAEAETAMYCGLGLVLPMITAQLLQFPKLCETYLRLVSNLFEESVEKVAQLPSDLFGGLLASLKLGITHYDIEISRTTLEALTSLLKFHCHQRGLAGQLSAYPTLLSDLVSFLLQYLLYGDVPADLSNQLADALLYVIALEQQTYTQLVQMAIEQQQDVSSKQRLAAAFQKLMSENGVRVSVDKENMKIFRSNLAQFLPEVKSFLLRK